MHGEKILYVLAGGAGVRYVERVGGRFFRTLRRIRHPIAPPLLLIHGNARTPNDICDLLALVLRNMDADSGIDGFDSLILVAPPVILDPLLCSLPVAGQSKVVACVDRDLSRIRDQDLSRFLPLHLIYRSRPSDASLPHV